MRDQRTNSPPPAAVTDLRVGVVVSRYHAEVTDRLLEGAARVFHAAGGRDEQLMVVDAPGSWELIPIAAAMLQRGDLDGVVTLGLILTGEMTHDRWLAAGLAPALADLSARHVTPVAFGVLTCQSLEQARARAGGAVGNKGAEAMESTLGAIAAIRGVRAAPALAPAGDAT
jgi:6,7-dimethyl-8-ribityllumazine synthase